MSYNWGPYFIVPTKALKEYSGKVQLREEIDENVLAKDMESLGIKGPVTKITNPWYYRRKGSKTWIKIGESNLKEDNFPVLWDTSGLENGVYEVLGLMHVFIKKNGSEHAIARQSIAEVTVKN